MHFDEESYQEIIIAICTVCHFIISQSFGVSASEAYRQNMQTILPQTKSTINTFVIAAQELMPPLCAPDIQEIVKKRVLGWEKDENVKKLIKVSDIIFDFYIVEEYSEFFPLE